mgnify:CR=1 FL=1
MKNKKIIFSFLFFLLSSFIFSAGNVQNSSSDNEKKFIKGSLSEKIEILQNLEDDEIISIGKKGLDFSIENASLLSEDSELALLAASSVRAFPKTNKEIKSKKLDTSKLKDIPEKFIAIFRLFKNSELRTAVMERLEFYCAGNKALLVDFINDYLSTAFKTDEKAAPELEYLIGTIGKIGNDESLSIVYNIWVTNIWDEYKTVTDEALVELSSDSFSDVIKIFSISKIGDFRNFFLLLKNSSKISQKFLCDIAENALLIAINNAEKLKENSDSAKSDFSSFQLEASEVLAENKWSHAASVVNENVILAKNEYDESSMTEDDFCKIIRNAVKVPSSNLAKSLTGFLSECNGKVEQSGETMPSKNVVLALILALGDLGDKTAFDTLLYTTYLTYPAEVTDEAKKSLAKLNW